VSGLVRPRKDLEIQRIRSRILYDEHGPYLPYKHYRIYSEGSELLPVAPLLTTVKESVQIGSSIETVIDAPKCIGQFLVGRDVVGHFSRVLYQGNDCLLTAFHVIETHHLSDLRLANNEKTIPFYYGWEVLAYSKTNDLDYIIFKVPSQNFSALQLGQGKFASNHPMRMGVCLYGAYEGGIGVSLGSAVLADRAFRIKYKASTLPSWSGTPVMSVKNTIIGVHTDGGSSYNLGSVIPISKESDHFGSMFEETQAEDLNDYSQTEIVDRGEHKILLSKGKSYAWLESKRKEEQFILSVKEKGGILWADIMDEEDFMKETLVVCVNCSLVQKKAKKCTSCLFLLDSKKGIKQVENTLNEVRKLYPNIPELDPITTELENVAATAEHGSYHDSRILNNPETLTQFYPRELSGDILMTKAAKKEFARNVEKVKDLELKGDDINVTKHHRSWSVRDGLPFDLRKVEEVETLPQKVRTRRKKRTSKVAKETLVPLKCDRPQDVSCGPIPLNGQRKNPSVQKAQKLDGVLADSNKADRPLDLKPLKDLLNSILNELSTSGH